MASTVDARQALTAMCSVLTAYTSCTGVSTATFAASMAAQVVADTSLTADEKKIITALTSALASAAPSSSIHSNLAFSIDSHTLYGAMTSILTAYSSASGTSTTNFNTAIAAQVSADTGLTNVEKALVNTFATAVGTATPSLTAHTAV